MPKFGCDVKCLPALDWTGVSGGRCLKLALKLSNGRDFPGLDRAGVQPMHGRNGIANGRARFGSVLRRPLAGQHGQPADRLAEQNLAAAQPLRMSPSPRAIAGSVALGSFGGARTAGSCGG
jgi:hypothetical protein